LLERDPLVVSHSVVVASDQPVGFVSLTERDVQRSVVEAGALRL
jgi:hypothetical protein